MYSLHSTAIGYIFTSTKLFVILLYFLIESHSQKFSSDHNILSSEFFHINYPLNVISLFLAMMLQW